LLKGYQWPEDVKVALLSEAAPVSSKWNIPADEKRAQSFQNEVRRNEFRRSRAIIRQLVIEQWDPKHAPQDIRIQKQADGRPYIQLGEQFLHIGISHCLEAILVAVSDEQIGIDIEPTNRKVDDRLRTRILSPMERNALNRVETLRLWTLKEAALKFTGTGLRFAMNRFELKKLDEQRFSTEISNESILIHSHQIDNFWVAVATHN
jgi:phosphopantetheinyl transferase